MSEASKILNNPIVVIDLSYRILAHSDADDINENIWLENIQRGYCSYEFIAEVKKLKSFQIGIKYDLPYELNFGDSSILSIVSKVK